MGDSESLDDFSPEELVDGYIRYFAHHREGDAWVYDRVEEIVRDQPSKAVELVLQLIDAAPDDAALSYIAAGPVEDLIVLHGGTYLNRLMSEARMSAKVHRALAGVWLGRADSLLEAELARFLAEQN